MTISTTPSVDPKTEGLLQKLDDAGVTPLIEGVTAAYRRHKGISPAKEALNAALDEQGIGEADRATLYEHMRALSPRTPTTKVQGVVRDAAPAAQEPVKPDTVRFHKHGSTTDINAMLAFAFKHGLDDKIGALQRQAVIHAEAQGVSAKANNFANMDAVQTRVSNGLRDLDVHELDISNLCQFIRTNPREDLQALSKVPPVAQGKLIDNKGPRITAGSVRFRGNMQEAMAYVEEKQQAHVLDRLRRTPEDSAAQAAASESLRGIGIHDVDIADICKAVRAEGNARFTIAAAQPARGAAK